MFKKILIANRGEIALRIIRACREMGIKSVAVYSEADSDSLHAAYADEAYCIGPASVKESYLNVPNILSSALVSKADAIHPGYGLLSENVRFAEACKAENIKFIGPSPRSISMMGDKAKARDTVKKAGVPVVPGSGVIETLQEAEAFAALTSFPLMLKAVSGGGGKGMRILRSSEDLARQFTLARNEALSSFGDGRMYIEKFIENARHIEFQVMADSAGNAVHFGERDCTTQRRNQKLVEESPSPVITAQMRIEMGQAAVKAALACKYTTAGTIEFIYDIDENKYYFMEMNTRIQVEHPVTEMVTMTDLVRLQIETAAGEKLLNSEEPDLLGHAIECRINAEDPMRNFAPMAGKVVKFVLPGGPGIRVDTHIYEGSVISPFYDSLLAKVIAWGADRTQALSRMKRALREFDIQGVKTTIPFHAAYLDMPEFVKGEITTSFVEKNLDKILKNI